MRLSRFLGKKKYILLFIIGMMIFLYPTFSNLYFNYITMKSTYENIFLSHKTLSDSSKKSDTIEGRNDITVNDNEYRKIESDPSMKLLMYKDLNYLKAYNKKLWTNSSSAADPFGKGDRASDEFEVSKDADGSSIFAYIKIDKIHQILPIYLGATNEHLKKGAAVINGTSIPVGGENTNSVIAGHTGMLKKFFTDLPELKPGDVIQITNRWETLYYKVTGNKLIWPDQLEYLAVVKGKDMITLLTCYHGTPQNDRLLVFAERYYSEKKVQQKRVEKTDPNSYTYLSKVELKVKPWYQRPQTIAIGIALILICLFICTFFKKGGKSRMNNII